MERIHRFINLNTHDKRLFLEAAVCLAFSEAVIRTVPFRWIAPHLGQHMAISPLETPPPRQSQHAQKVSWAVQSAGRHVPWDCKCLVRAMAAKAMLKMRGIPSTLYLGVAKNEAAALSAHAWLRCGHRILTGGGGLDRYAVVASFGDKSAPGICEAHPNNKTGGKTD